MPQSPDLRVAAPPGGLHQAGTGLDKMGASWWAEIVVAGPFEDQAGRLHLLAHAPKTRDEPGSGAPTAGNPAQVLELQDRVSSATSRRPWARRPRGRRDHRRHRGLRPLSPRARHAARLKGRNDIQIGDRPAPGGFHPRSGLRNGLRLALYAFLAMYRDTKDELWSKKALHAAQQAQRVEEITCRKCISRSARLTPSPADQRPSPRSAAPPRALAELRRGVPAARPRLPDGGQEG